MNRPAPRFALLAFAFAALLVACARPTAPPATPAQPVQQAAPAPPTEPAQPPAEAVAAPAQQAPATEEAKVAANPESDGLRVNQLAFGAGVQERELQDPADTFAADGQPVFAHVSVANRKAAQTVVIDFRRDDKVIYSARLPVGRSDNWRTWAYVHAQEMRAGDYTVRVATQGGEQLAEGRFTITGPAATARANAPTSDAAKASAQPTPVAPATEQPPAPAAEQPQAPTTEQPQATTTEHRDKLVLPKFAREAKQP